MKADARATVDSSKESRRHLLSIEPDGSKVECLHYPKGSVASRVVQTFRDKQKELGCISVLVNYRTGAQSLKGACKIHKQCNLWISSPTFGDQLIDWLAQGLHVDQKAHQKLAVEFKSSVGMKTKKTKS